MYILEQKSGDVSVEMLQVPISDLPHTIKRSDAE